MIASTLFSVWLIPSAPFQAALQPHIDHLAKTHDAPTFKAHTTLFCGKTSDLEKTKKTLAKLLKNQKPITLKAISLDTSEKYYKTLYIQFEESLLLNQLNQSYHEKINPDSDYTLNPHLSLLYKFLPSEQKKTIASDAWPKITDALYPDKLIRFDTVKLMTDAEEIGPEAVKNWKILDSYNLKK